MKRLALIFALIFLVGCAKQPPIGPLGGVHHHASFKVYIDGSPVDFAKQSYMVAAPHVHIEHMNGDIIHVHATGVTVGEFFRTIGMKFTDECFKLPGKKYCADEDNPLKFYVNGQESDLHGDYLIGSMDKMLISYGSGDIESQLASIKEIELSE